MYDNPAVALAIGKSERKLLLFEDVFLLNVEKHCCLFSRADSFITFLENVTRGLTLVTILPVLLLLLRQM